MTREMQCQKSRLTLSSIVIMIAVNIELFHQYIDYQSPCLDVLCLKRLMNILGNLFYRDLIIRLFELLYVT